MFIELAMPSNHLILCHPLLLLPSIFSASGSFQMSQLLASAGQSIEVSASISVLPRNGNPLQYSCLENPMDGGAWWATLHRVAKSWTQLSDFTFTFNEHTGLIFRMDWLDILAVQRTLKSLLQHHSSKTLILQHSTIFMAQLSHPYMTTGKTIALTRLTFVDNVNNNRSQTVRINPIQNNSKTHNVCRTKPKIHVNKAI